MEKFYVEVAGFRICVELAKGIDQSGLELKFREKILPYIKDFWTENSLKHDFKLTVIYRNNFDVLIDKKTKKHLVGFYEEKNSRHFITYYHISSEQFLIIIRNIIQQLLIENNGLILHGSAAANSDGEAIIFLGDSGAGKSTIVSLLNPEYQSLADDMFILKKEKGKFFFYQTPFIQKNIYSKKRSARFVLKKICFLKKGEEEIRRIKGQSVILSNLAKQLFTDKEGQQKQLNLLFELSLQITEVYYLTFSKNNKQKLLNVLVNSAGLSGRKVS